MQLDNVFCFYDKKLDDITVCYRTGVSRSLGFYFGCCKSIYFIKKKTQVIEFAVFIKERMGS